MTTTSADPTPRQGVPKNCPGCGHDFHPAGECEHEWREYGVPNPTEQRCTCQHNMAVHLDLPTSSTPTPSSSQGGTAALPVAVPPPGAWLEGDIALLKDLRAQTLILSERAAGYDTRLRRMFTDVEAEIRRALSALLLQKEDQLDSAPIAPTCIYCGSVVHRSQACQVPAR